MTHLTSVKDCKSAYPGSIPGVASNNCGGIRTDDHATKAERETNAERAGTKTGTGKRVDLRSVLGVFFINLDKSTTRRAHIETELDGVGLDGARIPAVDGATIGIADPRIDAATFHRIHHARLRPGEIGCYLSHVAALEAFLLDGRRFGLILEDDAVLGGDLTTSLRGLIEERQAWDIAKLYATHIGGLVPPGRRLASGHLLYSSCFKHSSSAAYVVNRWSASVLLDHLLPMRLPYDHEFDRGWRTGLKMRLVLPFPVKRLKAPSTIEDPTAKRHAHWKPWHQQGAMLAFRTTSEIRRVVHELVAR